MMQESRKTRYTRKVIRESYCELLTEKPVSKITVKEICERADINKGSFYNHYKDLDDLQVTLGNEIIDSIKSLMAQDILASNEKKLIALLNHIRQNQSLYLPLVFQEPDSPTAKIFAESCYEAGMDSKKKRGMPKEASEVILKYEVPTLLAIIRTWLAGGCSESTETVSNMLDQIISEIMETFCVYINQGISADIP